MRPLCAPCAGTVGMRIAFKARVVKRALQCYLELQRGGSAINFGAPKHAHCLNSFSWREGCDPSLGFCL